MERLIFTAFSVCRFRREDGGVRTAMSSPRGTRMRLLGIMKDALPPVPLPQPPKSGSLFTNGGFQGAHLTYKSSKLQIGTAKFKFVMKYALPQAQLLPPKKPALLV